MKVLAALASALIAAAPAHAVTVRYTTTLSGPGESPPNASPGTGFGTVIFDSTAHTLEVQETFSGLLTPTTASHIHCCIAPPAATAVATMVPTFSLFPLGVTSGSFDQTFDTLLTATYNPAFVTANGGTAAGAEAALFAGLNAGMSYLNIHTTGSPGGEIRGFLAVAPIPEPETYALMIAGLALLRTVVRRRKQAT
jgi:hypothetical protein